MKIEISSTNSMVIRFRVSQCVHWPRKKLGCGSMKTGISAHIGRYEITNCYNHVSVSVQKGWCMMHDEDRELELNKMHGCALLRSNCCATPKTMRKIIRQKNKNRCANYFNFFLIVAKQYITLRLQLSIHTSFEFWRVHVSFILSEKLSTDERWRHRFGLFAYPTSRSLFVSFAPNSRIHDKNCYQRWNIPTDIRIHATNSFPPRFK